MEYMTLTMFWGVWALDETLQVIPMGYITVFMFRQIVESEISGWIDRGEVG